MLLRNLVLECSLYFLRMRLYMFNVVVKFQTDSYNTFWDVNFFLVLIFGQVPSRQKVAHMSPPCISTGGLKNGMDYPQNSFQISAFQRWPKNNYDLIKLILCFQKVVRRYSVYCLVDEVLRHEKIMPDEKKKLAIQFFLFFPPTCKKNNNIFIEKVYKS